MIDVSRFHGMYVGDLTDDEQRAFIREVAKGNARRIYAGVGGFLGLSKVEWIGPPSPTPRVPATEPTA